jgi:hypothetical protein
LTAAAAPGIYPPAIAASVYRVKQACCRWRELMIDGASAADVRIAFARGRQAPDNSPGPGKLSVTVPVDCHSAIAANHVFPLKKTFGLYEFRVT